MSPPMLPSLKDRAIQGSKRSRTRGSTSGWVWRKKFRPSAHPSMRSRSQPGLSSYIPRISAGSMKSFIRRSRQTASSPSASASRPWELRKFSSIRGKSSSAWAYINPKTASASVGA